MQGAEQPLRAGVLEEEPQGAGAQRRMDVLVEVEGGQRQHPGAAVHRRGGQDAGARLDTVELGHLHVHQHHIGHDAGRLGDRVEPVHRFPRDLKAGSRPDQCGQSAADQIVVVGDEYPRRAFVRNRRRLR